MPTPLRSAEPSIIAQFWKTCQLIGTCCLPFCLSFPTHLPLSAKPRILYRILSPSQSFFDFFSPSACCAVRAVAISRALDYSTISEGRPPSHGSERNRTPLGVNGHCQRPAPAAARRLSQARWRAVAGHDPGLHDEGRASRSIKDSRQSWPAGQPGVNVDACAAPPSRRRPRTLHLLRHGIGIDGPPNRWHTRAGAPWAYRPAGTHLSNLTDDGAERLAQGDPARALLTAGHPSRPGQRPGPARPDGEPLLSRRWRRGTGSGPAPPRLRR